MQDLPFWKHKLLDEMSAAEWESLCDRCGRCCLIKLEDEDTGDIVYTRLACRLMNIGTCQCSSYADRRTHVPDCVQLTPEDVRELPWLPETCAYRLLAEGADLPWWHPLLTGGPEAMHEAGISVRDFAISEDRVKKNKYERFIISAG